MGQLRRSFTPEFKQDAVDLCRRSGKSKEPRPSGRGFLNQEDFCSSATLRAAIPPRSSERGILADLRDSTLCLVVSGKAAA
jgi:hypothetical protein